MISTVYKHENAPSILFLLLLLVSSTHCHLQSGGFINAHGTFFDQSCGKLYTAHKRWTENPPCEQHLPNQNIRKNIKYTTKIYQPYPTIISPNVKTRLVPSCRFPFKPSLAQSTCSASAETPMSRFNSANSSFPRSLSGMAAFWKEKNLKKSRSDVIQN